MKLPKDKCMLCHLRVEWFAFSFLFYFASSGCNAEFRCYSFFAGSSWAWPADRGSAGGKGGGLVSSEEVIFFGYAMVVGCLLSTTAKFKWHDGLAPGRRERETKKDSWGWGMWKHFVMNFSSMAWKFHHVCWGHWKTQNYVGQFGKRVSFSFNVFLFKMKIRKERNSQICRFFESFNLTTRIWYSHVIICFLSVQFFQ